jgi:FkbM family methyltransferase
MDLPTKTVKVNKYNVDVILDDLYIRLALERGYEWDQWMRHDLPNMYKPGTDILDIGGNIGFNSLMFSDYGPVHTFEPLFHTVVSKNASQNTLNNPIKVYPFGLSNEESDILIYKPKPQDFGFTNYGGCSMTLTEWHVPEGIPVSIKKLDDVYHGTPSVMKIDVENHEYKVLLGAENTIRKHKPSMYIEIFDFETSPIVPFLKEMGYNTIVSRPEHNYLFTHSP